MRVLLALACLFPATALAQDAPTRVEVRLTSFDFTPAVIRLAADRPIVLHLVNGGDGGHNFAAPEFFAAARDVSGPVERGRVEVTGNRSVEIRLTPARGRYRLRCTHTLHTAFGMTGEIVVE
jgi:uncharacterized cupredoxin-like copper-binding protein